MSGDKRCTRAFRAVVVVVCCHGCAGVAFGEAHMLRPRTSATKSPIMRPTTSKMAAAAPGLSPEMSVELVQCCVVTVALPVALTDAVPLAVAV